MSNLGWEDDEDTQNNSALLVILILVGIIIIIGLGFGGYKLYQRQTPAHAAEEWFEAAWAIDSETVLDRTCDAEIEVSNLIASAASVRGLIDFFDITSIPGLTSVLTDLLGEVALDIDLNDLGDQFEIDRSRIKYEEQMIDETIALVTVTGQIRFRVFDGWYPYRMNENWQVLREDDRWKWCGRQP